MVGYVVQATALLALVVCTVAVPTIIQKSSSNVELVAPKITSTPRKIAKNIARTTAPRLAPVQVSVAPPKIETPVLQVQQPQRLHRIPQVTEIAQPQLPVARLDPKILPTVAPKIAPKIVATNTFSGSSAPPTLAKTTPVTKVQTGGFGDPNGVPSSAHGSSHASIGATGAFDLPQGNGTGNGRGGTTGARGTVASVGFGNGEAMQATNARTVQPRIQSTSFTSQVAAAPSPETSRRANQPVSTPVSIQSKPTPVYTQEARQLRVEGEVLINVVFTAGGQIRIVNIVRGLGHGLDESAQRAAQGVKFSPAMRDGHPVDSSAILHIVFQLS